MKAEPVPWAPLEQRCPWAGCCATLPCLSACWLCGAGTGLQGGWDGTFWAGSHQPAPQSHRQSLQTFQRRGAEPCPKPWVLPAPIPRLCPGAQSPQLLSKGRLRAGKSLLATKTLLCRRGCELCKYLLYKSRMCL